MRRKRVKSGLALLCAGFLLSGITGCGTGKTDVDYSLGEQQEENTAEGDGNGNFLNIDTSESWKAEFNVNSQQEVESVKIAAGITVPNTDSLSVVNMEEPEFDADFKKSLAESIFGSSTIYIYGMEAPTRSELEERIELIPEWIADAEDSLEDMDPEDEDSQEWFADVDEEKAFYEAKLEEYQNMLDTAAEEHIPTTDFQQSKYISEWNGINYILNFMDDENPVDDGTYRSSFERSQTRGKSVWLAPEDEKELAPEELRDQYEVTWLIGDDEDAEDNLCSLSEEEARQQAEQFATQIGFSAMECVKTDPLLWSSWESEDSYGTRITNGYAFYFRYCVDGVQLYGSMEDYFCAYPSTDQNGKQYDLSCELMICVSDNGIVTMTLQNPLVETGITKNVSILSLDSIENIMIDELTENFDSYVPYSYEEVQRLDYMQLIYFRVEDDTEEESNRYSYIPVWRLSKGIPSNMQCCIVVNAIDGSVIDVEKEVFDAK